MKRLPCCQEFSRDWRYIGVVVATVSCLVTSSPLVPLMLCAGDASLSIKVSSRKVTTINSSFDEESHFIHNTVFSRVRPFVVAVLLFRCH